MPQTRKDAQHHAVAGANARIRQHAAVAGMDVSAAVAAARPQPARGLDIVHLINHLQRANGHVEHVVDLACEQAAQGHRVCVLAGPGDFSEVLRTHGVELIEIPDAHARTAPLQLGRALLQRARKSQPDIVHAHMVRAALIAKLLQALGRYRLVTTVHNSFDRQSPLMGVGDRVIAVSHAVEVEMAGKGIAPRKLRTVHNRTIGGKRRPAWPVRIDSLEHPSITTVCGLHPRKGVADLLEAFAQAWAEYPQAHLYVVGDGPQANELKARAAAMPCRDHVHWLGYRRDPREVLGSTDIFALATYADTCPMVVSEARQMGCAIVATHVGGIPELVTDGMQGLLVEAGRPDQLAEALTRLLGDPALRDRYSKQARAGLETCTVAEMARRTVEVYRELVGRAGEALP